MNGQRDIETPIGKGTALGLSPEKTEILVMHTRPKELQDKTHGATYVRWWAWSEKEQKITGEMSE